MKPVHLPWGALTQFHSQTTKLFNLQIQSPVQNMQIMQIKPFIVFARWNYNQPTRTKQIQLSLSSMGLFLSSLEEESINESVCAVIFYWAIWQENRNYENIPIRPVKYMVREMCILGGGGGARAGGGGGPPPPSEAGRQTDRQRYDDFAT